MQAMIFGMPGWAELLMLAFVGVLIFGRRLPEVGRNVGRGIVEFKKGLKGIEDEVDDTVESPRETPRIQPDKHEVVDSKSAETSHADAHPPSAGSP